MNTSKSISAIATLLLAIGYSTSASAFSFTFEWGAISSCIDGYPDRVPNPIFSLQAVPTGTKSIEFEMVDRNAPGYYHGGGTVEYSGEDGIKPGAFEYKSPCPPRGAHTYEWTAHAKDGSGTTLAKTKASRRYPE